MIGRDVGQRVTPPRLATWLLRRVLPRDMRDDVLGDAHEAYTMRRRNAGRFRAGLWYWSQLVAGPASYVLHYRRHRPVYQSPPRRSRTGLDAVWSDLRFALGRMRRRPGITAIAMAILALGIGGSTSVFTIFSGVLRPDLGVPHLERLHAVGYTDSTSTPRWRLSYREYQALGDGLDPDVVLIARLYSAVTVRAENAVWRAAVDAVSDEYFRLMGIEPAVGRFFATGAVAPTEVVLSYDYWELRFGGDPAVVGSVIEIDRRPFVIVGVAPYEFRGPQGVITPAMWVPLEALAAERIAADPDGPWLRVNAILASPERREAVATMLATRLKGFDEERRAPARTLRLDPVVAGSGADEGERDALQVAEFLLTVLGAVVLLAACFNVANMLLADLAGRRRELGIRVAIGASRTVLLRQMLIEVAVLSLPAAVIGLGLAGWLLQYVPTWLPPSDLQAPIRFDLSLPAAVLAVGLGVASTLIAGLVPAMRASSVRGPHALMRRGRRSGTGVGASEALVIAQVGAAVLLLVTAGLFSQSMSNRRATVRGYDPEDRLTVRIDLRQVGMEVPMPPDFFRAVGERLDALPSVAAATVMSQPPFFAGRVPVYGRGHTPDAARPSVRLATDRRYFAAMGTRLVQGRVFRDGEQAAVVSMDLAQTLWPDTGWLGQEVMIAGDSAAYRVVGIAEPLTLYSTDPVPLVVTPLGEDARSVATVAIHVRGPEREAMEAVRLALRDLHPGLPEPSFEPGADWFDRVWILHRGMAVLGQIFGALALVISTVGIYGRFASFVAARTREIGIRMALGAARERVIQSVLGRSLAVALVGTMLGSAGAVVAAKLLAAWLYGVSPADPRVLGLAVVIIVATVVLATLVPSRRAASVDPMIAMRAE